MTVSAEEFIRRFLQAFPRRETNETFIISHGWRQHEYDCF
jgi:hypothetical protein